MANGCISTERILNKLDEYLNKNDYDSALKHLLYWLSEAQLSGLGNIELLVRNELMGLYRKLGKEQEALQCVTAALEKTEEMQIQKQVGAATTFLNCATVYKAFNMPQKALPLFEKAKEIYESELEPSDSRLGGLYNNMALALVDLERYKEASELYDKAVSVMSSIEYGMLEVAITYLNMASAKEAEIGLLDAEETISHYLKKAEQILENFAKRDGYYAFVCEKCASVFGYYGYFNYEKQLIERAKRIYEGA